MIPDIQVIHVSDAYFSDEYTVYIGRRVKRGAHGLEASPLANPVVIGEDVNRDQVIVKYREWLCDNFDVEADNSEQFGDLPVWEEMLRLTELATNGPLRLACWCAPKPCHGDVIRDLILERLKT